MRVLYPFLKLLVRILCLPLAPGDYLVSLPQALGENVVSQVPGEDLVSLPQAPSEDPVFLPQALGEDLVSPSGSR